MSELVLHCMRDADCTLVVHLALAALGVGLGAAAVLWREE